MWLDEHVAILVGERNEVSLMTELTEERIMAVTTCDRASVSVHQTTPRSGAAIHL